VPVQGLVLDSFALLAFFRDEAGSTAVEKLLRAADRGEVVLSISSVNMGEVIYRTIREFGPERGDEVIALMQTYALQVIDVNEGLAVAAARIKGSHRISYADCIAAALAQRLGVPLVTGDTDFKRIQGLAIEWLPSGQ
jgi:predicted nucleic acid-binding protein